MPHWLDQYAAKHHAWRKVLHNGIKQFYRPFGLVETAFDSDGLYHEGRADINAMLTLEVRSALSDRQFRERILLAWTALRLQHALLMSKAVEKTSFMVTKDDTTKRAFLICPPSSTEKAVEQAAHDLVFLDDHYPKISSQDLYRHAQNTGRVLDPDKNLAKLFVLSHEVKGHHKFRLEILLVMGHQISDGLTNYTWLSHFLRLLNMPKKALEGSIRQHVSSHAIEGNLPLPQEDLYPPITGTKARQRWFWAITRVLRHVKAPQPAAFSNPLYRTKPKATATPMQPIYTEVLDYDKVPPLNTFTAAATINATCTQRLHRLCREAGTSIGAGCFVLVAMVMMALHERKHPNILLKDRLAFIGSFPINPRPFFNHASAPDSLMLAFSDGVVLPFLPSSLPFEGRFRLLARQAHRQLSIYQKRPKANIADMKAHMSSRGAGRVIAMNYISAMERIHAKLPSHLRDQVGLHVQPQGSLTTRPNPTTATCGVSSVGRSGWKIGEYDLDADLPGEDDDAFVADYRGLQQNVRARDGEFLVGIGGNDDGIGANVSYDGNAIDEESVVEWKRLMETILVGDEERARL